VSIALYRKYRSATFADLIGQAHVADTLRNQVRSGELAHAYLFSGIRGTGKTSTARILARAITCLQPAGGEPCNRCTACVEVLGGGAVDVLEIDAASNRGIDEMRELRERVKFLPASLRRKVYIIDEAHMLTTEAWNAFLKTLEEPPPHVLFILATTEPHKVPETVRSRVQRFDFRRVERPDIAAHLGRILGQEGAEAEPAALDLLARAGQGSVRDAMSLLDQALGTGERPLRLETVRRSLGLADPAVVGSLLLGLAAGDAAETLRATARAFESGADARQLLRDLSRLARAAELVALGASDGADLGADEVEICRELAGTARRGLWVEALDAFAAAEINLRQPVDARLQVELSLLRLLHGGGPAGPGPGTGDGGAALAALSVRVAQLERRLACGAATPPVAPPPRASAAAPPAVAAEVAPPPRAGEAVAPPVAAEVAPPPRAGEAVAPVAAEVAPPPRASDAVSPPVAAEVAPPPAAAEAVPAPEEPPVAPAEPAVASASEPPPASAPPAATAPSAGPPADLDAWQALWTTIVDAVNRRDPMLAGVLRSCRPLVATPGRLVVGAPYGFHLERLQERQKARLLDEVISEVAGGPCTVEAVFSGSDPPQPPAPPAAPGAPDATAAVLATFPGSRITASRLRDTAADGPA
jgi:DNA polymerase-3 subunit gamma/tau